MAQRVRIDCINKADRYNPHERISSIGGRNPDGSRWRMPQSQAIAKITDGTYSFYVQDGYGSAVDVIVARSAYGHEYLKTKGDGEHPNNLLSLTECPL